MPDSSNKLSQFWQELKRRNVVRVITVYAGVAFVIIELINNITEPLHLPEWTPTLVIVLLAIGFPVVIIFSWIYDVRPEGGIEKTKPAHKVKSEDKPVSSSSWKIASYISFVVIVALIILNVIPKSDRSDEIIILDKSIAVLPFINDSPDNENVHIINGIMEAILDNLCKIEDLRVIGRTSVEQYRDNPKPIPEIGKEMNVSYILEGSGQKYGNNIRLTLQLLDARNDKHLWSSPYNREIVMEQIFDLQSDIAELVAGEIKAVITPEEKQLIEKTPTTNLTAYDFYQRGLNELRRYDNDTDNQEALEKAEDLFYIALEYDSTFAKAYCGLAEVLWNKQYYETYLSGDFLDSVLIMLDLALTYDEKLAEAHTLKGRYLKEIGEPNQALREFDRALRLNPNDWRAHMQKAFLADDLAIIIENYTRAVVRCRDENLPNMLGQLGHLYANNGFIDRGRDYFIESFTLQRDSVWYYYGFMWLSFVQGKYDVAADYLDTIIRLDSSYFTFHPFYTLAGQHQKAYSYYKKIVEHYGGPGSSNLHSTHRIGYAFWKMDYLEESEYYFKEQIRICTESIKLDRPLARNYYAYYDLAAVHSFLGDMEKAYQYLEFFNQKDYYGLWWVNLAKNDPLFDNIAEEDRFQEILQNMETKYHTVHERVRKWLEENDML